MLVKIKEDTYLNIKNVAYISVEEKDFSYTTIGSKELSYVDFDFISRDELIALFENENAKQFLGGLSDGQVKVYLNVEAIVKVIYETENDGTKVYIWFINDENPYAFRVKNENKDEEFIDKFIKDINEILGEIKPQYVDHF